MDWNLFNYRQQLERDEPKTDLFSDTLFKEIKKKTKGATSEVSEQRELLAKLLGREFRIIAGLTRNWTIQELYEIRRKAENFKANPRALAWNLIKEHNKKIKELLKV